MNMHWGSNLDNNTRPNTIDKVKLIGSWSIGLSVYWLILRYIASAFITVGFPRLPREIQSLPMWPLAIGGFIVGLVIGTVIGYVTISYLDIFHSKSQENSKYSEIQLSLVFGLIISMAETLVVISNIIIGNSSFIHGIGSFFDIQTWLPRILITPLSIIFSVIVGLLIGLLLFYSKMYDYQHHPTRSVAIFSFVFFVGALLDRLTQVFFSRFRWNIPSLPINNAYFILNSIGSFVNGVVIATLLITLLPKFYKHEKA